MNTDGQAGNDEARFARALVFCRPGEPLRTRTFPQPTLGPHEAWVEITCCTICGSDLHTIRGDRPVSGPTVLGHETIGRIRALPRSGPVPHDVSGAPLALGDRITWSVAASCGECFFCDRGLPQKCDQLFKYGHETIDRHPLSGGLAEFCHLTAGTPVVKVPDALEDHAACPANCATATVAAAVRTADGCHGKAVLIHGAGMLGLTTAAMAAQQGASAIIVSDLSVERLGRAHDFGATHTVHVGGDATALSTTVHGATAGRGVDVAFEMSGAPVAVEQSIDLVRIGGQLVLVGAVFPTRPAKLNPETIVRKLLRIDGVHNYTPGDLTESVRFLSQTAARFPFASLVGKELNLDDLNAYLAQRRDTTPIRIAVRPGPALTP